MRRLNFGRTISVAHGESPRKRTGTVFSLLSVTDEDRPLQNALFDTEKLINEKRAKYPGLFQQVEDECKRNELQPIIGTAEISAGVSAVVLVERHELAKDKVRVKLFQRNGLHHELGDLNTPLHLNARMEIVQALTQFKNHLSTTAGSLDIIMTLIERNNRHKKRF